MEQLDKIVAALIPIIDEIAELSEIPAILITNNLHAAVYKAVSETVQSNYEDMLRRTGAKSVKLSAVEMEGLKNGNT